MLQISTKKADAAPVSDREPLFALDDVEHTIPRKFLPTDMLQYLFLLGSSGPDAAANWALMQALGDKSYWALIDAGAAITEEHLRAMIDCVTGRMLGMDTPVPGPKANLPASGPDPETDSTEEPPDAAVWPGEVSNLIQE
jgi:hypothetical protein